MQSSVVGDSLVEVVVRFEMWQISLVKQNRLAFLAVASNEQMSSDLEFPMTLFDFRSDSRTQTGIQIVFLVNERFPMKKPIKYKSQINQDAMFPANGCGIRIVQTIYTVQIDV